MTPEEKDAAIEWLSAGESIAEVLRRLGLSVRRFYSERENDPAFERQVTRALHVGADITADSLVTMFDKAVDRVDIDKARGKSDNLKWLLERRARDRYAPSVDVNVAVSVDVKANLERARQAVTLLPPRYPAPAIPAVSSPVTANSESSTLAGEASDPEDEYDFGTPKG